MASLMDTLRPESALHEPCMSHDTVLQEKVGSKAVMRSVDRMLGRICSRSVDEILEMVIVHVEHCLKSSEDVKSPSDLPAGIHSQHSRQIEVCLARFKAAKIPAVSLREYLHRIHRHCPFSPIKLLAIIHYLTMLDIMYREIAKIFRPETAHRLILAAVVIASKVLEDIRSASQLRFAQVGGISLHSLHGLELAFFFLMNGRVWINDHCLGATACFLLGESTLQLQDLRPLTETDESDIIWSEVGNRPVADSQSGKPA